MRIGLFISMTAVLAVGGVAMAQAPAPSPAAPPPPPAAAGHSAYGPSTKAMPSTSSPVVWDDAATYHQDGHGECCDGHPAAGYLDDPYVDGTRLWASGEYILWRISNTTYPTATVERFAGNVSVQSTQTFIVQGGTFAANSTTSVSVTQNALPVLVTNNSGIPGGQSVNYGDQPGGRFSLGYWLDRDQNVEVDGSFFIVERRPFKISNVTGQSANQGVPTQFSNTTFLVPLNAPTTTVFNQPVLVATAANVSLVGTETERMWGAEANVRCRKCYFGPVAFDILGGFRFFDLDESFQNQEILSLNPSTPVGSTIIMLTSPGTGTTTLPTINQPTLTASSFQFDDKISGHNRFYGAQAGISFEACCKGLVLSGFGKLAVGDMHETFQLIGISQQNGNPFQPAVQNGGLLVAPLDNGTTRHQDRIALLPELNLNIGYKVTNFLTMYVGYDALYVSSVARPGDQVLFPVVTNTQITVSGQGAPLNVAQPAFHFKNTDAMVQGINGGIEIRY